MRISFLTSDACKAIALACCLSAAGCSRAAPSVRVQAGAFWPVYQGMPTHNAVYDGHRFASAWTSDTGAAVNGSLAVANGVVLGDTLAGTVFALDMRTGKPIWQAKLDNKVMTAPIVDHGLVIVGTGRNGAVEHKKTSFVYESASGSSTRSIWGRLQGDHVVALSLSGGKILWKYRTAGEDMPSGVIARSRYVFANGDAHAYALDPRTGVARWRTNLPGISTMASAARAGGDVVVAVCTANTGAGATLALGAVTGKIRWRSDFGNCDSSPTYDHGTVFVSGVTGDRASFGYGGRSIVAALDAGNGSLRWRYESPTVRPYTGLASSERAIAATAANGTLFQSLPQDDEMIAFDERTGAQKWMFHTAGPVKMSPIVANGNVYFGDVVGLFYTLSEHSGTLLRARIFHKPFSTSPPILYGDTIIVANGTKIHAFPISSP